MDIQATNVFERNYQAVLDGYRYIANQGGSRSSKTYSIVQLIIVKCLEETGKTYSIVRKTFPALKNSVMKDFFELLHQYELYDSSSHNKTDSIYILNGNRIEFFSLDDEQKIRGTKRNVLYCNEMNDLDISEFQQLTMRTTDYIIVDYNPSEPDHFIYTNLLKRSDCKLIKSTFLDNPYLDETIVKELLWYKDNDPDWWQVYGKGEVGKSQATIFSKAKEVSSIPDNAEYLGIGIDFGFTNDPTAVIKLYLEGRNIYYEELVYETGLTNNDIYNKLINLGIDRFDTIYADSAEPKSIEELKRKGLDIRPVTKGKDSIMKGIDTMKSYKIHYIGENLNTEFTNYKWKKDRNGQLINTPIDKYNHAIDAARYISYMVLSNNRNKGVYNLTF